MLRVAIEDAAKADDMFTVLMAMRSHRRQFIEDNALTSATRHLNRAVTPEGSRLDQFAAHAGHRKLREARALIGKDVPGRDGSRVFHNVLLRPAHCWRQRSLGRHAMGNVAAEVCHIEDLLVKDEVSINSARR